MKWLSKSQFVISGMCLIVAVIAILEKRYDSALFQGSLCILNFILAIVNES